MSHIYHKAVVDISLPLYKSGGMIWTSPSRTHPSSRENPAFTLIELLCVMAIMGLMLVLVVPVTGALKGSGSVNDATLNVSLILEQARAYAMANNTYVWVGFSEDQTGGNSKVTVSAVAGTTGLASDIASSSTYRPVIKPKSFENIRIQPEVPSSLPGRAIADNISGSSISTFSQRIANSDTTFRQVIQFEPKGSARIKVEQSRWIEMGLQPSNNGRANNENIAAFQIAGLTGQVNILRP